MMTRITILLTDQERAALRAMAEKEMRGMRDQARYIVRTEVERHGYLPTAAQLSTQNQPDNTQEEQSGASIKDSFVVGR